METTNKFLNSSKTYFQRKTISYQGVFYGAIVLLASIFIPLEYFEYKTWVLLAYNLFFLMLIILIKLAYIGSLDPLSYGAKQVSREIKTWSFIEILLLIPTWFLINSVFDWNIGLREIIFVIVIYMLYFGLAQFLHYATWSSHLELIIMSINNKIKFEQSNEIKQEIASYYDFDFDQKEGAKESLPKNSTTIGSSLKHYTLISAVIIGVFFSATFLMHYL